jgi:PKD repeat protein
MAFQAQQNFHLGMNIHGGAEVINYPWDNRAPVTADDAWWRYICQEYVDTARGFNSNYMRGRGTGVTNGADWYIVYGSRQDYANYFDHCRELTLEISSTKMPSASNLPNFWNWNYRSFLNFIEQGLYGIHGTITDATTGLPMKARIEIIGHDNRNSHVFSDTNTGYYARPIKAGTYTLTYSAQGYAKEVRTLTITDKQKIVQDIQLLSGETEVKFSADFTEININGQVNFTNESFSLEPIIQYAWEFEGGTPSASNKENPTVTYNSSGSFDVSLTIYDGTQAKTLTKENYINVTTLPNSILLNENSDMSVNIYPNPAKDVIYIEAKSIIKKVELIDITGKQVLSQTSNYDKTTVKIAHIMPGMYLLRVHFDDGFVTSKILISE